MTSPMTVKGAERLKKELHDLKTVRRPAIIKAIAEARAHGDLSENAEYHAAREQQSLTEGKIASLEGGLGNAQIIDVSQINANGKVVFGATVNLLNLKNNDEVCYQIVGEHESDVNAKLISVKSPIARALIGKLEGDVVQVNAPNGMIEYEIIAVKYIG